MIQRLLRLALTPFAVLMLMSCAGLKGQPDTQFPYFGDITPKTEIRDARLETQTTAPPAIWHTDTGSVRHVVSGAVCPDSLSGFLREDETSYPGLPRGFDVACVYRSDEGAELKLHLTHFGRDVSLDAHIKGVDGTIVESYPVLGRVEPPTDVFGQLIASRRSGFRLRATAEGAPTGNTITWLEDIGGWHVKIRATFDEADRRAVGAIAGELYLAAQEGIDARQAEVLAILP